MHYRLRVLEVSWRVDVVEFGRHRSGGLSHRQVLEKAPHGGILDGIQSLHGPAQRR